MIILLHDKPSLSKSKNLLLFLFDTLGRSFNLIVIIKKEVHVFLLFDKYIKRFIETLIYMVKNINLTLGIVSLAS